MSDQAPSGFHFHTLSCAPDRIGIVCPDCGRKGLLSRAKAIAEYGAELNLPDYLVKVSADCPRRGHAVNGASCAARYDQATIAGNRCGHG
jgi:hypothetical protein